MDVIFRLCRRLSQRGSPLLTFLCLRPTSTPTSCLYAYGLPLIIFTKSITVIIVTVIIVTVIIVTVIIVTVIIITAIVHFLFKRNFYLSLLCDL
jgi:hypothetical protein